ncbi:MAG TPA: isoleucine--tRNA ligase, partial [Candidatus Saccharimonadales bacterium]|nr:isoleucine--tRNA ligase [Candidatus Saccharimonadales bacterium]
MFKEIESVPNFPEQEKQTLKYWQELNVVEKLKNLRKGSKAKVYYDGPITANGLPHYGHAITWTMKDVIPRYWAMKGYYVDRSMGWDTKGILVEYEAEKELGFKSKEDIKTYGEAKFIQYCRDFVAKFQQVIMDYEGRLGRWFDPAATYSTADAAYVESMWWALKELYKKGLLYEGHKTVAYDTRAGMTLSTHEVADGGYKEVEDSYVTVRFRLVKEPDTYFLAWTTTPWTVPGNLMIAANKDLKYAKVLVGGEKYIVAKDRVDTLFEGKNKKILEELSGAELEGLEYDAVFKFFENKRSEGCFRIILSSHANADEGTGLVHLAPYGEEDYELFMKLGISMFDYLNDVGHFTSMIPQYEGLFYKDANSKIIDDLQTMGSLFATGKILHRMPIGSRTGTPLIYKPVKSWYIATSKIKDKMIEQNQLTNWYPEHLKNGNAGIWIQNARDWALSRTRYWGTPLPIWVNDETGEQIFIGSFAELEEKSGAKVTDPHRPFVDEITWKDDVKGGTFRRIKDVIDVWFDSGCMPFAHVHYPFENEDKFKQVMPADYISEGPDQVRLWFYVMHVVGVALFNQIPYKNVVTIGTMLDENGKKMSKSKRNYKPMDEVLDQYGADILRYFVLNSQIVKGSDAIFKEDYLIEARKEFFLILWNSLKYFSTYANLYELKPSQE